MDSEPQLCINGCGFFGSSSTENMCSKCYKDHLLKNKIEATPAKPVVDDETAKVEPAGDYAGESKPGRCFSCRKRVGLLGFNCRCGNTFCGLHRYAEEHGCSFDYKKQGREDLAKANPTIKPDKVDRI